MAVTTTPIFAQAVRHNAETISTANTNRDGSGTLGSSPFVAGTNGSQIDHIDIVAAGATTAGVVRLFIHNGSTAFLWREILVGAITPSATVSVFRRRVDCSKPENELVLPSGWSLKAATHNAESFVIHTFGYNL